MHVCHIFLSYFLSQNTSVTVFFSKSDSPNLVIPGYVTADAAEYIIDYSISLTTPSSIGHVHQYIQFKQREQVGGRQKHHQFLIYTLAEAMLYDNDG